jgi:membrane fusion protein (multidrug efflux system)
MVTPETPIVEITKRQPIFVDFTIPQLYSDKFAIGDTVSVTTDMYPNQMFTGRIKAKQASIEQDTRSLEVRAQLPNKNRQLIPGSFVQVKLRLGTPQEVTKVPKVALMYETNAAYVYTIHKGHAYKKPVEVIAQRGEYMIIKGDLDDNSQVVTGGQIKLTNGTAVKTNNQCD